MRKWIDEGRVNREHWIKKVRQSNPLRFPGNRLFLRAHARATQACWLNLCDGVNAAVDTMLTV